MGIRNVTPDSFSDGGRDWTTSTAVLINDVGGGLADPLMASAAAQAGVANCIGPQ